MHRTSRRRARLRAAGLVFLVATLAGVYFATQVHFAYPEPVRKPWGQALAINLAHYWTWGAFVPLVVFLARRFRFENRGWLAVPIHLAAGILLTAAEIVIANLALAGALSDPKLVQNIPQSFQWNFHSTLPTYFVILFVYYAFEYSGRAARLKASLTEARLDALKTQLDPHFLFNTLNSISSLMYSDREAADRMMARLSDLLRSTLHNNGAQEVTLREELGFVERYIEIEKIRFEERLRVDVRVEREALDALVPAFSLQPLVENSLRHGIGSLERGGAIEIEAHRVNGLLSLRVSDDGRGSTDPIREGIGLSNTRSRLKELYGGAASLELGNRAGRGFFVQLEVPFRTGEVHP